jgi:hypothetical protein
MYLYSKKKGIHKTSPKSMLPKQKGAKKLQNCTINEYPKKEGGEIFKIFFQNLNSNLAPNFLLTIYTTFSFH